MTRYTTTTAAFGYRISSDYSDRCSERDFEKAAISRIVVRYDAFINELTVFYVESEEPAKPHGGVGVKTADIVLEPAEWIVRIEGGFLPQVITYLTFVSNLGRTWGPFGSVGGTAFVLDPGSTLPSNLFPRMGLLYFDGNCDENYIRLLQATFAEYSSPEAKPPGILKFESRATDDAESTVPSSVILSTFTKQLMSPIITLSIGPHKTELRAYEAILCGLPFFRAALQGDFKEASEKAITMPEDDPETIGALIEFLYTGSYTYAFKPASLSANIPVSDVTQGAFHVAVYAVASKYDCATLISGALRNVTYVLKQLRGFDAISLLKAAYGKGLYLSQFENDADLKSFMGGLPKLVKDTYETHHDEMARMVAEYPDLGSDLLRLVATAHAV